MIVFSVFTLIIKKVATKPERFHHVGKTILINHQNIFSNYLLLLLFCSFQCNLSHQNRLQS